MRELLMLILLLCSLYAKAQNDRTWQQYFDEESLPEDLDAESGEITYDELSDLAQNPLDLNTCRREDLERLPFLSSQQVMDIMEYRDRYHRFESTSELMMITSLDWRDRERLLPFVTVVPEARDTVPSFKSLLRRPKQEVVGTIKIPFYKREGDKEGYLGYQYRHWLRYTLTAGQHLKIALIGSQDAGEPFFSNGNSLGYDFYSGYVLLRHIGHLKAAVVGRYKLRFGMGLVLNTSFGMGKLATLSTLGRSSNSITGHGSRSEGSYLQGGAATVTLVKGLDLTGFVSWRKIDATLTDSGDSIVTILKTGYHRTASEMRRRRDASQLVAGGNINYFRNGFHLGVTGFYSSFDKTLAPDNGQIYRRWYPAGRQFWNAGVDYGYLSNKFTFAGETATGSSGGLATLNSVSFQASSQLSLVAVQRFYAYQYRSLFSNSFSEGGYVNNESGVYFGVNYAPLQGVSLQVYTDYSYFAWATYRALPGSRRWDNMLTVTLEKGPWTLLARYRLKLSQQNLNTEEADKDDYSHAVVSTDSKLLLNKTDHKGRLSLAYTSDHWQFKTQGDVSYSYFREGSFGWMVSEVAGCRYGHWRLSAMAGYFHTADYDSRLYVYVPGVLYQFSFPSFYGKGVHCALNVRCDFSSHLMAIARLSATNYFDRSSISSGLQMIDSSSMTDLELQLRWKF